jgi:hypothetical protein
VFCGREVASGTESTLIRAYTEAMLSAVASEGRHVHTVKMGGRTVLRPK